jgi:hypothetical protein
LVINHLDSQVTAWNRAIKPWSVAYRSGDRARFLSVQEKYTGRMYVASVRIRLGVVGIADPPLRTDLTKLARAYRAQYEAVLGVDNSVVNGDLRAGQRAIVRLQRAANHKVDVVAALVDDYPILGSSLGR